MRYLRQRDKHSCAPISVINALKWCGEPVTMADLPKYASECRLNMDCVGTKHHESIRMVKQYGVGRFTVLDRWNAPYGLIKEHMNKPDTSMILSSGFEKNGTIYHHMFFVYKMTKYFVWSANLYYEETTTKMSWNKFKKHHLVKKHNYSVQLLRKI